MTPITQKIVPTLWFDSQSEQAAQFYTSLFENSHIGDITRYGKEGFEIHGQPEGKVMTVDFTIAGFELLALNGGPIFEFTPAISLFVVCETEAETDRLWEQLLEGGSALMPLDAYAWSDKYGWVRDRYGLTWQISLGKLSEVGRKITPSLLFPGHERGNAEDALELYTNTFKNSKVAGILRYGPGENAVEGTVKHAQFSLDSEVFMVMDSPLKNAFTFNEAVSLAVLCIDQAEIDYYWDKLSRGGDPKSQQCGWLEDRFGVAWQVVPIELNEMMKDPDTAKVARVTKAFLQMKKFDLAALRRAYTGS